MLILWAHWASRAGQGPQHTAALVPRKQICTDFPSEWGRGGSGSGSQGPRRERSSGEGLPGQGSWCCWPQDFSLPLLHSASRHIPWASGLGLGSCGPCLWPQLCCSHQWKPAGRPVLQCKGVSWGGACWGFGLVLVGCVVGLNNLTSWRLAGAQKQQTPSRVASFKGPTGANAGHWKWYFRGSGRNLLAYS